MEHFLDQPKWPAEAATRTIRLSVKSIKNTGGVWKDSLAAWTEVNDSSEAFQMDVAHTTAESKGKRIMLIQESTQAPTYEEMMNVITFHPRCGKNSAILNKGLTVKKLNLGDPNNAVVFTNRPLKDEEIFEVKIEGKNANFKYGFGLGYITKSAEDIDILPEMYKSPFCWIYYDVTLYNNSAVVQGSIGKSTDTFQIGDRIGMKRSEMGTLHFYFNGEDQGPVMSNVPQNIYGVLELRGCIDKASIYVPK